MSYGKKMTLVPIEMLENMTKNSTLAALQEPDKEYLLKKIDSVNDLNTSTDLPENVKANRLAQNIKEVSVMANKIIPSESINAPTPNFNANVFENYEKHLENIPKTYQRSAKALLRELRRHQNRFLVDEKTNEVTLDGTKLANSNFVDLIGDIARSRKRVIAPLYREKFIEFLSSLNVPEELIGNKMHIKTLRKYKATNNQNRVVQEELDADRESDNIESVKVESDLQDVVFRRRMFKPKLDKSHIFKLKYIFQKTNYKKKIRNNISGKKYKYQLNELF